MPRVSLLLFRYRPESTIGYVLWLLAGVVCTGLCAVMLFDALSHDREPAFSIFVVSVFAIAVGWVGIHGLVHVFRNSSFGRIPLGITISRLGVAVRHIDGFDRFPWDDITTFGVPHESAGPPPARAARASSGPLSSGTSHHFASILRIESSSGVTFWGPVDSYSQQPWLIYTGIRFYWEHPELRHELGTSLAQRRFEAWNDEIQQRVPARP